MIYSCCCYDAGYLGHVRFVSKKSCLKFLFTENSFFFFFFQVKVKIFSRLFFARFP